VQARQQFLKDLIDNVRHVRATLQEESYHNSEKANVFPSSERTDTKRDNCFHFKKSPDVCFILFYDDRKERLLHLLYHILFLLKTVGIYLEVLQQIMSAIIAIFVTVSNQLWVLTSFITVTSCLDGTDIFMASCSGKFFVCSWREHCSNLNFRKILNTKMKIK